MRGTELKERDGILRVGGVGTGRIFQWAHLNPYLPLMDKAWLVAFHDISRERAQQARDKYESTLRDLAARKPRHAATVEKNIRELRVCATLDEMLGGVDLIDICTTTQGRMESALAALERGVHSMGEKPMCRTWVMADRAARAFAQRPDIYFQLNDDNVFDPLYMKLRDVIAAGEIGNVVGMTLIRGSKLEAKTVLKSQATASSNGGGCLMDYGSHGMAGVWSVLGPQFRPVKVEAIEIGVLHRDRILEGDPFVLEVEDNARFKVLFQNAATGGWATVFMEATWCGGHIGLTEWRGDAGGGGFLYIYGDEGIINASRKHTISIRRWDGRNNVITLPPYAGETLSFNAEIATMVDCIRDKRQPQVDVSFGADIIAICGAAYWSAIEKRAVTLDEFKAFCRGYLAKQGDTPEAEEALLRDLMKPYTLGGAR
jgi:predicted dehydrogenase